VEALTTAFWTGRRVLITGHTGFKGSWLSLWLQSLGAEVYGFALAPPATPTLFAEARVGEGMVSLIGDIRDACAVREAVETAKPEVVLHLAAQPLVRASYQHPVATYETNIMGTIHVLEAIRQTGSVRAMVNVTTDKCYENREWIWGYREHDPLGGHDPYSSSKACAELVTDAYRRSFLAGTHLALATARAGNVIGGGDWSADRLVPDLLRAFSAGTPATIRHPDARRPWQFVLDPLAGYLQLAHGLISTGHALAGAWNFGPRLEEARPVWWIADRLAELWGAEASWIRADAPQPHEALQLALDSTKSRHSLGWRSLWDIEAMLHRTVTWHRARAVGHDLRALCLSQITEHMARRVESAS
jgi:CDP-glucose 4,6-dehydratase